MSFYPTPSYPTQSHPTPSRSRRGPATALVVGLALLAPALSGSPAQGRASHVDRVSVGSAEQQARGASTEPAVSASGRYVAFTSNAQNLVRGTHVGNDIFVRDRWRGTTRLVSRATGMSGSPGNGASWAPSISLDGRYVAFTSQADNLVRGDTNGASDGFVRDLETGETRRVTLNRHGAQLPRGASEFVMSGNGRFVVFGSASLGGYLVLRSLRTGSVERVSVPIDYPEFGEAYGGPSAWDPSVSADGRYVGYQAIWFTDSLPFLRDTVENRTLSLVGGRAELWDDGVDSVTVSSDGRFVAFVGDAGGLNANPGAAGEADRVWIYSIVRDRYSVLDSNSPWSFAWQARVPKLSMSRDGRVVAYYETQGDRIALYVLDRATSTKTLVADVPLYEADWELYVPRFALDGRGERLVFASPDGLVAGDTNGVDDVFLARLTG